MTPEMLQVLCGTAIILAAITSDRDHECALLFGVLLVLCA